MIDDGELLLANNYSQPLIFSNQLWQMLHDASFDQHLRQVLPWKPFAVAISHHEAGCFPVTCDTPRHTETALLFAVWSRRVGPMNHEIPM